MMTIEEKSLELYEKRIAPYAPDLPTEIKAVILDCQKLVFTVDHYFETKTVIDPSVMDSYWKQLEAFLAKLGISDNLSNVLLEDIRDYADIEESTRAGKKLAEYDIRFFYLKKSCDVRMQRHIARFLTNQNPISSLDEINKDIAEEIEDDLDDIEEDKLTPLNGNRFLEILNTKDVIKLNEYRTFIQSLENIPETLKNKLLKQIISSSS